MSSILKALKKVEGGHPKYIHVRSWPRGINAKKAISNRTRSAWFVNQLITVLLAALVFFGIGFYIIGKKPAMISKILSDPALKRETPTPVMNHGETVRELPDRSVDAVVSPDETDTIPAVTETETAAPDEIESVSETVDDSAEKTAVVSVSKEPMPDLPPKFEENPASRSPEKPVEKTGPIETKQKVATSVDKPSLPKEGPLSEASPAKPAKTVAVEKAVKKTKAEPPVELPAQEVTAEKPGDDIGLTLQALVWSEDAESCFAVIDDVIVRKGEIVKGYTVKLIGKKHVMVDKDGKTSTLKFK